MKRTKKTIMKRTKNSARNNIPFTFVRKRKPYDAFQKSYYDIMVGSLYCGAIVKWNWSEKTLGQFRIRLLVYREDFAGKTTPFKWVTINAKFHTSTEAKEYAILNSNHLQKQYKFTA